MRRLLVAVALVAGSMLMTVGAIEVALSRLHLPFDETWVPSETALARFDPELG